MNRRGVTLIELLMAIVIGSIAMFALAAPLLAGGQLFRKGKRQTEAQRDAQLVLRTMDRFARSGTGYDVSTPGVVSFFNVPCDLSNPTGPVGTVTFEVHTATGEFHKHGCNGDAILIDGARSKVASFTAARVIPTGPGSNKLVRLHLDVTHQLRTTGGPTNREVLDTDLFMRNGT